MSPLDQRPVTQQWAALGTYAQIVVDDDTAAPRALEIGKGVVAHIDATCSRFRPDSDLSRASARAGSWVQVDPMLVRALDAALGAARATGGLVDPTLGRHLVELGYDRDLHLVRQEPPARLDSVGAPVEAQSGAHRWREVGTDAEGWVRVPAGCTLDLGATGKAFAADLVAQTVAAELGCSVIVSLGGDVAALSRSDQAGWQVLVSDNDTGDLASGGQVVLLTNGGLATSSTRHRRWTHAGAAVHHIVDPRTGRPAEEVIVTATVCASTCVDANAASTAAIILGREAPEWLSERRLSSLLVDVDANVTRCADWPAPLEVAAAC